MPSEDRPGVPNKSHSKGHNHFSSAHYTTERVPSEMAGSQRQLSFKDASLAARGNINKFSVTQSKPKVVLSQKQLLIGQRSEPYLQLNSTPQTSASNNKPPMRVRHSKAVMDQQVRGAQTSRSINMPKDGTEHSEMTTTVVENTKFVPPTKLGGTYSNATMIKKLTTGSKRPPAGFASQSSLIT